MRLGGPLFDPPADPGAWASACRGLGYAAAYCPLNESCSDDDVRAYAEAARAADLVIAEVGAWSNPLSPDDDARRAALELCRQRRAPKTHAKIDCFFLPISYNWIESSAQ